MPCGRKSASVPMPDCIKIFGVLMAPVDRITSRSAMICVRCEPWMTSTPITVVLLKTNLDIQHRAIAPCFVVSLLREVFPIILGSSQCTCEPFSPAQRVR
jgi:hypothetical protein